MTAHRWSGRSADVREVGGKVELDRRHPNARTASSFFRLPPDRVVELGAQIEL